jgi:hypothetical protein
MLVQIINLGKTEWECEYDLDAQGKLSAFRAFRSGDSSECREVQHIGDFTESEQAAIVQTLTGC